MAADTSSKDPSDVALTGGPEADARDGSNRRAHPRLKATEVGGLEAARLASGAEIKLIDLSRGGAQFESDRRFLPNSTVSLRLVTHDSTFVVNGRVVRSRIVRLDSGGLGYNVAVAFNELLQHVIDEQAPASAATPVSPPAVLPPSAPASTPIPVPIPDLPVPLAPESVDVRVDATDSEASASTELGLGVTAEEGAAFEAAALHAPAMLTVTAAVDSSGEELLDMFNGNDW